MRGRHRYTYTRRRTLHQNKARKHAGRSGADGIEWVFYLLIMAAILLLIF